MVMESSDQRVPPCAGKPRHVRSRHACLTSPARNGNTIVNLPTVPLPPIGITPNRLNGTENVTTFGVTSRITMTSAGLVGISLSDMLLVVSFAAKVERGLYTGISPLSTPKPMTTAGKRRMVVLRGPGRLRDCGGGELAPLLLLVEYKTRFVWLTVASLWGRWVERRRLCCMGT